jgi:SAM-dependent methyltransferase
LRPYPASRGRVAAATASGDWDDPVAAWPSTRPHRLLRAYSDAVNRALLERWLDVRPARLLLKTDLFDEAVGAGLYALLAARAETVVGIDASAATVAAAQARYPGLRAELGDVRSLAFPDETFDVVVSNSTLDHFRSREELFRAVGEVARVTARGGRVVLTLDNPLNPLVALRNALPLGLLRRAGLVQHFVGVTLGPAALRRVLEAQGLRVEEVAAVMHVPRVLALALAAPVRAGEGVERLVRGLLAAERLAGAPTRYVTGQFVAVRARRL